MQLDDTKPYIIALEELLSPAECASLVRFIDDNEPSQAPVMTINGEAYKPDIRNNQRVMTTDTTVSA